MARAVEENSSTVLARQTCPTALSQIAQDGQTPDSLVALPLEEAGSVRA